MTHRKELLEAGIAATCGERDEEYGDPRPNFENTASLWNAYIRAKYPNAEMMFTCEDVAWLNNLQKMSRAISHPGVMSSVGDDTYIDAAVFAAIAGELK